ncbi:MAG: hypothetical protein A2W93_03335 [Bacteroidetes bacterium GWF2_43_63]|nr:MAG: hypothetical protein A2W94_09335 [Bacteroidetes bacterium GWE2_42_42]OFY53693.1 MAG: hypothetical protein A2W93_03335 [Bacteroidetes bacterium GWF2_43_63]HBG70961.1 hypothetical protein [Bacteroidales bacterium]HCB62948.1 hypothetical protein [Bacteroidales bacterium]HCY24288.1 hypothetical protein [Bacteroidales bacterium]
MRLSLASDKADIKYSSDNYSFGFNGKENDNEVKGTGNSVDFGARIYDSRLGRWMSVDPLFKDYPDLSPYCFAANSPILFVDRDGKKIYVSFDSQKAIDSYLEVMNMGLEGQFAVGLKAVGNGQYEVVIGTNKDFPGNVDDMTPNGKAFYEEMNKLVTDTRVMKARIVYDKENVDVGKATTAEIDMYDIKCFNPTGPFEFSYNEKVFKGYFISEGFTQIGKLAHELVEQFAMQLEDNTQQQAHIGWGVDAENNVNNNTRTDKGGNWDNPLFQTEKDDGTVTDIEYTTGENFSVKQSRVSTPVITEVKGK